MKKAILLISLSLILIGCTTIPTNLSSIEKSDKARKYLEKNSMVFGRLVSDTQGYFLSLSATNLKTRHKYTITPPPRNQLFSKNKEDNRDGYYFSILPPGDYKVYLIGYSDGFYSGSVNVDMNFSVPEHSATYLGTVIFSWEKTNNYLVYQKGQVWYSVRDESEDAIKRFWRRFPELKEDGLSVKTGLIEIEKSKNE